MLGWNRGGFWLHYKRLELGSFGVLDRAEASAHELYCVLAGIEVVRERVRYERKSAPVG